MMEIKPCPFCGNDIAVTVLDQNEVDCIGESSNNYSKEPYFQVVCCMNEEYSPVPIDNWHGGCGASSGYRKTREEAIEAWNRRIE